MTQSLSRFLAEARYIALQVVLALAQRGLPTPASFYLTERNNLVWLVVVLDLAQLAGRLEGYISADTQHQISTMVGGKPLFLSNSSGLRYLILLTPPPTLPDSIAFPADFGLHSLPLGLSLAGPVALVTPRNLLICGEPGSGKSTLLESIVHAALRNGWMLYFADPDGHTFNPDVFDRLAAQSVAQSPAEVQDLVEWIDGELLRRQGLFRTANNNGLPPADLDAYNQVSPRPLRRMLLLVDEANSYFDRKAILESLTDLARRGRKWGLAIVLAGHNWRAADVPRSLSAMFPVRVSFRVSDDTTATVVLGSRRWGKLAQQLHRPGRSILLLDGQYRLIQAYRLSPEQAHDLAGPVDPPNPLNALEQALVTHALLHLDGRFIVNQLASAFAGQGVTSHQVKTLAAAWERRGWLTAPQHATDGRKVTDELASLAGFSRTGAQAAQGRTGALSPAQALRQSAHIDPAAHIPCAQPPS